MTVDEPIYVTKDKLPTNQRLIIYKHAMIPHKPYRFKFLGINMVAVYYPEPDAIDLWYETTEEEKKNG